MSVLQFLDRQKVRDFDRRLFRRIARALLEELLGRTQYELGVHLVGAREMATINETFLGHQGSTDVITFNHGDGDGAAGWPEHAPYDGIIVTAAGPTIR